MPLGSRSRSSNAARMDWKSAASIGPAAASNSRRASWVLPDPAGSLRSLLGMVCLLLYQSAVGPQNLHGEKAVILIWPYVG